MFSLIVCSSNSSQIGMERTTALLLGGSTPDTLTIAQASVPSSCQPRSMRDVETNKSEHLYEKIGKIPSKIRYFLVREEDANFPPVPLLFIVNGGRYQIKTEALFFLLQSFNF